MHKFNRIELVIQTFRFVNIYKKNVSGNIYNSHVKERYKNSCWKRLKRSRIYEKILEEKIGSDFFFKKSKIVE